jgi:hypothetical protein
MLKHNACNEAQQLQVKGTYLLGHFSGAKGEARRDHGWQPLRNGRNCKRHSNLEVVGALAEGECECAPDRKTCVWGRLPGNKVRVVDSPHEEADDCNNLKA